MTESSHMAYSQQIKKLDKIHTKIGTKEGNLSSVGAAKLFKNYLMALEACDAYINDLDDEMETIRKEHAQRNNVNNERQGAEDTKKKYELHVESKVVAFLENEWQSCIIQECDRDETNPEIFTYKLITRNNQSITLPHDQLHPIPSTESEAKEREILLQQKVLALYPENNPGDVYKEAVVVGIPGRRKKVFEYHVRFGGESESRSVLGVNIAIL